MILKKILFTIILFSITNMFAQTNTNFMVVDNSGNTYEVNISTCSVVALNDCSGGYIASIALINNMVYFTDGANLFRYQYNTSGSCEFLVSFSISNPVTSLTSGPNGLVYAAAGSTILSYNPTTTVLSNLGDIPSPWRSSGDLIFYENELLLTTTSEELVKIDLTNLSNSQAILSFPANTSVYGLATISPACSTTNLVFGLNATNASTTQLLPLDLINYTVGTPSCTLPFRVFDAASLSENGSTNLTTPTFTAVAPICSGDALSALPTTSNNGLPGTWSPAINNTVTTTYTFTPTSGVCTTNNTMTIIVNPIVTPTFAAIGPICSGNTIPPLPTTSDNSITGTWSPALNNTATTTYTFTPTSGLCTSTTTLIIIVDPNITTIFTPIAPICTGDTVTQLPTTSNNGVRGTWFPPLNNSATTTYTFTPASGCATAATLTVSVIPPINVSLNDVELCIDSETQLPKYPKYLSTNLNQSNYTYNWYQNGNLILGEHSNDLLLTQIGQYHVAVTDTTTNCVTESNIVDVTKIDVIDEFNIEVIGEFTDNASIVITPFAANLLYRVDELPFQSSNVFENVSYGVHSISVTDSILCTDYNGSIFVPGYPKFFTPNGDGNNDFWNVFGFTASDSYRVFISDRYGKFINEINNRNDGWDGKLNGKELPSTDYWFVVNYYLNNQSKTFKGHFSLKR